MKRSASRRCGEPRTRRLAPNRNWPRANSRKFGQMRKARPMKTTPTPPIESRIRQIRADIEAIIDARAEMVAKESPGVPQGVIRKLLTARAPACPCAQYLEITGGDTE